MPSLLSPQWPSGSSFTWTQVIWLTNADTNDAKKLCKEQSLRVDKLSKTHTVFKSYRSKMGIIDM